MGVPDHRPRACPEDRLKATVFTDDDEAYELWKRIAGLNDDRILRLGRRTISGPWAIPAPAGPCSEVHFHQGDHIPCAEEQAGRPCLGPACDCDRWLEIWNLVFMQFNRAASGEADAAAQALHRHGHGARARRGGGAGKAIGLRHRSLPPDHQSRRAHRQAPLRRGRRPRRVHAGDRRPRPHGNLPHHGRGDALQRMARLCPAPDHAASHAPWPHARAHRALLVGCDEDGGGDDGPRLSRDRGGAGGGWRAP